MSNPSKQVHFHRTLGDVLVTVLALNPVLLAGCGPEAGIEDDPNFVPVNCMNGVPDFTAGLSPSEGATSIALLQHGDPVGFPFGSCQDHICQATLNVTRGTESLEITTREGVLDFLWPIDTPAEAILLAEIGQFSVLCGLGGTRPSGDGFDVQAHRPVGCDGRDRYLLHVNKQGDLSEISHVEEKQANPNCVVGRRPHGLCPPMRRRNTQSSADYLAHAAELEAASVFAFEHLAQELAEHGAPLMLGLRARAAARDERRHARSVAGLARRFGAEPEQPRVTAQPTRDLEALAIENAQEGCVRETYGAVVGAWQARHAQDRAVSRAYQVIAKDETRHAELAWRVARFLDTRLSHAAKRRVAEARAAAVAELYQALEAEPSAAIRRDLGVPGAAQGLQLADELRRRLWV